MALAIATGGTMYGDRIQGIYNNVFMRIITCLSDGQMKQPIQILHQWFTARVVLPGLLIVALQLRVLLVLLQQRAVINMQRSGKSTTRSTLNTTANTHKACHPLLYTKPTTQAAAKTLQTNGHNISNNINNTINNVNK